MYIVYKFVNVLWIQLFGLDPFAFLTDTFKKSYLINIWQTINVTQRCGWIIPNANSIIFDVERDLDLRVNKTAAQSS